MARIRTIKPEFFTSEDIVSMTPLARVFYVALWCEADREGRLSWKPKTLKMRYLPGDECDVDTVAQELIDGCQIILYEVDGATYAEIPSFKKHQVINNRESESNLPSRVIDASSRVKAEGRKEGKGKEGKEIEDKSSLSSAKLPDCPHVEIIDLFAKHLPTLPQPQVELWAGARAKALQARWRWVLTAKKRNGEPYAIDRKTALDFFDRYFAFVSNSDFLTGRSGVWTACDLTWLVNESNFAKVMSGNYENSNNREES
jgi:hypothetical protein